MMIYLGQPGSGERMPIEMTGVFTDQGVVNEQTVGKSVVQRTVIRIENNDRHIFELYFTPLKGKSNWRFALSTRASSNLAMREILSSECFVAQRAPGPTLERMQYTSQATSVSSCLCHRIRPLRWLVKPASAIREKLQGQQRKLRWQTLGRGSWQAELRRSDWQ